ncbi:hypothetical protein ACI3E1_07580, partial [Ligilactobacillus sp. LYQ139]|uniref:hypothetical protein n=1 Tax=Ligilactobacillus sp. LYQ139 TaxID=3378800 RepID=UPI003852E235
MGNSVYNCIDCIVDNAIIPSFSVSFLWFIIKYVTQRLFGKQLWCSVINFIMLIIVVVVVQWFTSFLWNKLKEHCIKISVIFSDTSDNFDISNSLKIKLKDKEDVKRLFVQVFADGYRKQTSESKPIVISFSPISVDLFYDERITKEKGNLFYEIDSENKKLKIYPNKLFGNDGCNNSKYVIKLLIQ